MKKTNSVRPASVGYFSSYDRGLECLLEMWPEVVKELPDATLDIYYGWDIFDKVNAKNPELMRWRFMMTQKIKSSPNVTEHGRVSHTELARVMKEIKVWAYPTEFTEIHCITALKAQEAGCIPVTTGCYALEETVQDNTYTVKCEDIYSNKDKQEEFIQKLIEALRSDHTTEPVNSIYENISKIPKNSVVDATPELSQIAQAQFAKSKKIQSEVATIGLNSLFQLKTPENIQKYILDAEGNPIGGICGFYEGSNRAILRNVYILPEHRNQGFASKLIKAFEQEIANNGATEIKLVSNEDKLYKKLGYQIDTSRAPGEDTNYFTKTLQTTSPVKNIDWSDIAKVWDKVFK